MTREALWLVLSYGWVVILVSALANFVLEFGV
jgi:hypothetical protein